MNQDVIWIAPSGKAYYGIVQAIDTSDNTAYVRYFSPYLQDWISAWRPLWSLIKWDAATAASLGLGKQAA